MSAGLQQAEENGILIRWGVGAAVQQQILNDHKGDSCSMSGLASYRMRVSRHDQKNEVFSESALVIELEEQVVRLAAPAL